MYLFKLGVYLKGEANLIANTNEINTITKPKTVCGTNDAVVVLNGTKLNANTNNIAENAVTLFGILVKATNKNNPKNNTAVSINTSPDMNTVNTSSNFNKSVFAILINRSP